MEDCSPSSQMNYKLLFEDSITKACSLYSVWKVLAAIWEIVTLYFWMNDQNLFWFKKIPNKTNSDLSLSMLSSNKLVSVHPRDNINETKWDQILDNILILKW